VTHSEIPQLEVVTAIPDAESEDFLSQLLFSQGWSIIYRAFDTDSLHRFMRERSQELRTVLVYQSDFPGFSPEVIAEYSAPTVTFISLDSITFTSHEIMVAIREKLRAPMLHSTTNATEVQSANGELASLPAQQQSVARQGVEGSSGIRRINRPATSRARERQVIAITGSTGAPGRTRFATLLAQELAQESSIMLIDADIRSQSMAKERKFPQSSRIEVVPLDRQSRPTEIPGGDETAVVDLGTLPGLAEAVTDRRWHGSLVNNVLDRATHLVYVSKSTPTSMAELAQFHREYPLLLKRIQVSYICILTGHSRELREWENKFLTLTLGEERHVLRESQLEALRQGGLLGGLRIGNPRRKEMAKIVAALR